MRLLVVYPSGSIEPWEVEGITNSQLRERIGSTFRTIVGPEEHVLFMADERSEEAQPNWLASSWATQFLHPADRVFGIAVIAGPSDEQGHVGSVDKAQEEMLLSRGGKGVGTPTPFRALTYGDTYGDGRVFDRTPRSTTYYSSSYYGGLPVGSPPLEA